MTVPSWEGNVPASSLAPSLLESFTTGRLTSTPDEDLHRCTTDPSHVCVFCDIPSRQRAPCPTQDRIILQSASFYVVPALGPLWLGHVLVVHYAHSQGLRFEAEHTVQEFRGLVDSLRSKLVSRGHTLLEIEHGGGTPTGSSPCITHTHVHLFPNAPWLVSCFDFLPTSSNFERSRPYLSVFDGTTEFIYDATSLPGQALRRVLAGTLGQDDWDWALFPKYDLVRASAEWWQRVLCA